MPESRTPPQFQDHTCIELFKRGENDERAGCDRINPDEDHYM